MYKIENHISTKTVNLKGLPLIKGINHKPITQQNTHAVNQW